MKKALIFTFIFSFVSFLRAELFWENTEIEKETPVGAKSITAEFKFKNTGNGKIKILSLGSDCGCTTAELEKKEYEEGESGEIKVTFDIGERIGPQEKRITVLTDDNKTNWPKTLVLKTVVPEILIMEKRLIVWKQGESLAEKTVSLKLNGQLINSRLTVACDNRNLKASISGPDDDGVYTLAVSPDKAIETGQNVIKINVFWGENESRTFSIFTRIQ